MLDQVDKHPPHHLEYLAFSHMKLRDHKRNQYSTSKGRYNNRKPEKPSQKIK